MKAEANKRLGAIWGISDQALSSITNVVVVIAAARTLSAREFGVFSLVYTTWIFTVGLTRALVSEPLLTRPSDGGHQTLSRAGVTTAALVVGLAVGAACVVAGLVLRGSSGSAVAILGLALGPLLYQDAWRFVSFSEQRPKHAFVLDAIWALLLVITLGAVIARGERDVSWVVASWAVSGAGSAAFAAAHGRVLPSLRAIRTRIKDSRELGIPFAIEYMTGNGSGQVGLYALGAIAGVAAVGSVRAAFTFFGPFNLLYQGAFLVAVPMGARLSRKEPESVRGVAIRVALALGTFTILWTAFGLLIPLQFGMELFGEAWLEAEALIVYLGMSYLAYSVAGGAVTGLRSLAAARASMRTRLLLAPLVIATLLLGALFGGAQGFAIGLVVSSAASAALWWRVLSRELATSSRDPMTDS